ncbi:protein kinase [Parahaliea maris]|uniref:Protein kinase n=1 Tax=Parahaliea maris TaxID=2716870 RepID=A0A5C9A0S3_9GAMM|nr:serine/threonine-protein kinase [Parahaliea maris]TXS93011.1 protein kinase [Parahaliea maris]
MAQSLAVIEALFEQASSMEGDVRRQFLSTIEPQELRAEVEDLLRYSEDGDGLTLELQSAVNAAVDVLLENIEDPKIGTCIGRFEIRSILGEGGHTRVYLAYDPALQREVAIKVLSKASGLSDERFMIEARAVSALNHPHIGLVYEIGESQDGEHYLVMPFYTGETLAAVLRKGALPVSRAVDIAIQVAQALCAAHQAGIVHRDVKAANVIFESADSVRLLDFGIAKLTQSDRTEQNIIVGTVAYMSPEQTRGSGVDQRTDVWSLGILLYEMITGTRPFHGDRVEAVIHQIRHDEVPDLAAFSPWLRGILQRALAKEPGARFHSMGAFLGALQQTGSAVDGPEGQNASRVAAFWKHKRLAIVLSLTLLGAALIAVLRSVPNTTPVSHPVAVIPFAHRGGLGNEGEYEYLGEGLSGQLRDQLGSVAGLQVVGRDSSREFRLETTAPAAIAAALDARWLISGELEYGDEGVQLRLFILDGASGRQVWSRSYQQGEEGLLDLQERVFDDAAQQLVGESPGEITEGRVAISSDAAFSLMLLANSHLKSALEQDVIDQDKLDQAIATYRQALAEDPGSALLNSRMAAALLYRGNVNEAQVFIEAAQATGQQLSQVEHTVGLYLYARHADGVGEHLRRAVELNPSNADALADYGLYLVARAETLAARPYLERARDLDPMSIRRYEALGNFYATNGWYAPAEKLVAQISGTFDSAAADLVISRIYEVVGDLDKAIAWSSQAREQAPMNNASRWRLAELYTRIGDLETARQYDPEQSVATLYFSRQYDELIEMAFNLVLEDKSSAALFTLARAYAATDRPDIVIRLMGTQGLPERLYRDSATLQDIEAGVMLADALMEAGSREDAVRLIDYLRGMFRQWAADMNSWHPHMNLACLLSISGEQEMALAELEKTTTTLGLLWYPVLRDQPCFRKRMAGNRRYQVVLDNVLERKRKLREVLPQTLEQVALAQTRTGAEEVARTP